MSDDVVWSADCNMDEISLNREGDGTWKFVAGSQGEYGEPTVFLDLRQLKELRDKIDEEIFKQLPFFDQLREVQAIVDEANRKVDE